jgi:hypothetical protein
MVIPEESRIKMGWILVFKNDCERKKRIVFVIVYSKDIVGKSTNTDGE